MTPVALLGAAGTTGIAIAAALHRRGLPLRVVGRHRVRLDAAFADMPEAERVVADLTRGDELRRALSGAAAAVYCAGVPYTRQGFGELPGMMRLAVEAARSEGVRQLLLISNVYSYGLPGREKVSEAHSREPVSVKGRFRKEQEDVLLGAHNGAGLRTLVLRLPDFYGPHAERSFSRRLFEAAVAGKRCDLFAPADTPHEFVFVPDIGPVVGDLLARADGWGEAYNFAGPETISTRDFAAAIYSAAGKPFAFREIGPRLVRFLGLFNEQLRELAEMHYLQAQPVNLDDTKLQRLVGKLSKTPYRAGIEATLGWMRKADWSGFTA
jgi:nucleoside-diphosphate-sugar epimerase